MTKQGTFLRLYCKNIACPEYWIMPLAKRKSGTLIELDEQHRNGLTK